MKKGPPVPNSIRETDKHFVYLGPRDGWMRVPAGVSHSISTAPKQRRKLDRRHYNNEKKLFPEVDGKGIDGGPWPFDVPRAYRDQDYRDRIRHYINRGDTDEMWRFVARRELAIVIDDLLGNPVYSKEDLE